MSINSGSGVFTEAVPARTTPTDLVRASRLTNKAANACLESGTASALGASGPEKGPRKVTVFPSGPIADKRSPSFRLMTAVAAID